MDWSSLGFALRYSLQGFTDRAVNALVIARKHAVRRGHQAVTPEHVLLGLATIASGCANAALERLGIDLPRALAEVAALADATPQALPARRPLLSPELECLLVQAKRQAQAWGQRHVGTEHLLLGLLLGRPCPAADYLRGRGVTADLLRQELQTLFG
jgi:ATP-dependent Clp protease ATP-binding subunit ClpA